LKFIIYKRDNTEKENNDPESRCKEIIGFFPVKYIFEINVIRCNHARSLILNKPAFKPVITASVLELTLILEKIVTR
jgi:hypothetical protein